MTDDQARGAAKVGRPAIGLSKDAVLDVAERLAQTSGYNGFSYADIASRLGITKASLHYHFASKAELGAALIRRYRSAFAAALATIDARLAAPQHRLRAYAGLYEAVLRDERMCLCGMLAAEYATLPSRMQAELGQFFGENERWLSRVLLAGRAAGALRFRESPQVRARVLIAGLEGAMLLARAHGSPRRFHAAVRCLLTDLRAA